MATHDTIHDTIHDAYSEGRASLIALGRSLDEAAAVVPVPALPGWTVKDTYAHLAGIAADALAGRLTGPPTDEVTAAQVAERRDNTLTEVIDEWEISGAALDERLAEQGRDAPRELAIDIWSHEVDIRSALGLPLPSDRAAERILDRVARRGVGFGWADQGLPAVRIVVEDDEWVVGAGDPVATLTTSRFELGRVMLGRRSSAQMSAMDWGGADSSPWVGALAFFGPAELDIIDSPRG